MNTYTNKFSCDKYEKIKSFFESKNASIEKFQYAFFRAKTINFTAVFYNSGKFVLQGSDVSQIAQEFEKFLGNKSTQTNINLTQTSLLKPQKTTELEIANYQQYIGTDESGKGDYFGPLVIAGVLVTDENKDLFCKLGIKDSKKLTDNVIKKYAAEIKNNSIFSIVTIMPSRYNELYEKFNNLNKLLAWGHARVIENILEKKPNCEYALSDKFGDESLIKNSLMQKGQKIILEQKHRAESDVAVAAASIIARAEFVKRMEELSLKFDINLSKGASDIVIKQAKEFLTKYSKTDLKEIAKLHFKTTSLL